MLIHKRNLIPKSRSANPGTRLRLDSEFSDQVPNHYGALAKLQPHLIPRLLHTPVCHLAGPLCRWYRCQQLWASQVNDSTHEPLHASQTTAGRWWTLSRTIDWHIPTSI